MSQFMRQSPGDKCLHLRFDRPSGTGPAARLRKAVAHLAVVTAACIAAPLSAFGTDLAPSSDAVATPLPPETQLYGDFRDNLHDWKVTIGAGAVYMPEYEGSDKFEIKPVPLISATFADQVHLNTTGISWDLFKWQGLTFSAQGGYDLGRKEDDSKYLRGLGDIDPGGVVGGKLSYQIGFFEVYGSLNKIVGGSEGLTGTLGAKASYQWESLIFSADASATWADKKYMETYFGVTAAQSVKSGLAQYEAKAGFKRVDLKASVTYMLTENWMVTGSGGAGLLIGDAKDSPIVKDDVQPFVMLGVGYRF